jgi:flagellar biosynthesis GTPase FlhF
MQTKTYFANNVPAALEIARQELGEDALLVNSKPAPAHARSFGRLEVTFAWDPPLGENAKSTGPKPVPSKQRSELDEIRQQIAHLEATVGQSGGGLPKVGQWADQRSDQEEDRGKKNDNPVFARLCAAGLGAETARETVREIPRTALDPQSSVVQSLARRIPMAPFVEVKPGETRVLAFVGPPGRGKTLSLVKIAVAEGLARQIPVRIYSVGAHGVGGQEQIARYGAILGVPHQSFEAIENLSLALQGDAWKGLVLIDTPGLSASDRDEMNDLTRFFSGRPEIEKHLVLRADARSADMLHVISRFAGLRPSRLLFTGIDDALSAGAMAEALIRSRIPGTFAGTGQQIPDDLEVMDAGKLARDVWVSGWVDADVDAPMRSRAVAA